MPLVPAAPAAPAAPCGPGVVVTPVGVPQVELQSNGTGMAWLDIFEHENAPL